MWLNIWDIVVIEAATWIITELLDTWWLTTERSLTGCGYSALSCACRLVTWQAAPYPNYLKAARADPRTCPITMVGHAALALAENCPVKETQYIYLSIYLSIYECENRYLYRVPTARRGGEGEIIKMLSIVNYLSIYLYRYKISCIIQISFF